VSKPESPTSSSAGHDREGRSPLVFEPEDHVPRPPRRFRREPPHARMGLNLASMIDIVFLLLVFFMVATRFKLGEEVYRLDLPERGEARVADPFQLDDEPLRILVRSIGRDAESYRIDLEGPYGRPTTFEALHQFLLERQVRAEQPAGLFPADHPIIVQPGPATRWEHAIGAFNAAARARYTNISFAEGEAG